MKWRYLSVLFFFFFALLCVSAKLFYWQVVRGEELTALGRAQYQKNVTLSAQRGDIRTSDDFPLATTKLSYLVYANPKEIDDKEDFTNRLSPVLGVDSASISALVSMDRFWVALSRNVDNDTKSKIDSMHLRGVGFEDEYTRFYPEASTGAQLLGFVGKNADGQDLGYFGLEGFYDRALRGRSSESVVVTDGLGRPILSRANDTLGEQDGRTLILNVDRVIQFMAEQKLSEGVARFGAKSGSVIIMDPKTGGVLAMASVPSFDPRDFALYDPSTYHNPLITDTYEPGSTFKPLVMAAGIESKLVTPTSTCPICDKPVKVGDYEIHTWNNEYFPNTNMIDIMTHSDNTGMVYVAQQLGLTHMLTYINSFGIGDMTGIDLQGESAGILKPQDQWYPIDLATAGFGQGLAVTPIELIDAYTAIANRGSRMQPQVVSQIQSPDGQVVSVEPRVLSKPISPETAKIMTEMLVHTVNEGEAKFARLKGYRIAGKTGTASIPVAGHYDANKTIASFIGFAPADDPKFLMLVVYDEPTTSPYGAETAAPTFFDIAKDLLMYYGIAPTEDGG